MEQNIKNASQENEIKPWKIRDKRKRKRLKIVIITQIVTLSKYGHDSLNICHP